MKTVKIKNTPRVRKARLKKFSKHWLEAVRLSDVSVLADSGDPSSDPTGGTIIHWVDGPDGWYQTAGVAAPVIIPALATALKASVDSSKVSGKVASKILSKNATTALTVAASAAAVVAAANSTAKAASVSPAGAAPITGVGAFVSPWNTRNPASNPPLFNFSKSFIALMVGGHSGKILIEHVGNGGLGGVSAGRWKLVATLDGAEIISVPYNYHGANQSYLEINVALDGTWTFWGEFGSISRKVGSNGLVGPSRAGFGCSAGAGDYLMYNSFTNCAVNYGGTRGWSSPNFAALAAWGDSQFTAAQATEDSVLFQDNPPY